MLRLLKKLLNLFSRKSPDKAELVRMLRGCCASLMLERDEFVRLAPIEGMYGPVKMYGSINPSFEFQAFNYERKEYMDVRVEVSSPDRMRFYSCTSDEKYNADTDPNHERLALKFFHLITTYFPLMPLHKERTPNG